MERNKWDATERIPAFACVYIPSNIEHQTCGASRLAGDRTPRCRSGLLILR